ncbi:MAG: PAAR-like domain-containing protein [Polyangiaceae bacterium]
MSSVENGMCFAMPDTCKVPAPPAPPIPIPFPNMGQVKAASKTSKKVLIRNKAAVVELSEIPTSMGDEAGVGGGVVSGAFAQKITFKKGSAKVLVEGKGAAFLTCTTGHNGANANAPNGAQIVPSQSVVFIAP